uniref:Uncharacterized protein n=1 Tax=Ditylenchus dipsaci TaxID=166011 RepID=A0A915E0F0_9BILA
MMLASSSPKTAVPAMFTALKQESSQDNDCSPPGTLNGSVSPKSIMDENDGSATSSSPSSTPTVSSIVNRAAPTTTSSPANEGACPLQQQSATAHNQQPDVP